MRRIAIFFFILSNFVWAQNSLEFNSLTHTREQIEKVPPQDRAAALTAGITKLRKRIHEMKTNDPSNPLLEDWGELRMTLSAIAVLAKDKGSPTQEECARTHHDVIFMIGFQDLDENTKQEGEEVTRLIKLFCPQSENPQK